ncbi:hypothetical protein [Acidomonas methanolica]|uniref:Uncharacterized protein n=1 Tax=Acidomonas methanolica NBRC 104435 TaxID=1231351 RepID=A0A023D2J5_ACIMT|nr:hypothetical protein [Acidomonas methanolica]TCS31488.1 hypothetical protein EDC31_10236 [Acidomonas methanolica]GAJ28289.1 hypothetical protein Amme_018_014 [Acidomonas methanolica NBRC 104435]GEK97908.1 hypothetical protein AME01nite_04070 [Acidomonas methanolica NBRC 104435]
MTRAVRFSRFALRLLSIGGGAVSRASLVASLVASVKGGRFFFLPIILNSLCKYDCLGAASLWLCARRAPLRA